MHFRGTICFYPQQINPVLQTISNSMDFICKKCWTQKRVIISDQQKNKLFLLPTSNLFTIIRNVTNTKDVLLDM